MAVIMALIFSMTILEVLVIMGQFNYYRLFIEYYTEIAELIISGWDFRRNRRIEGDQHDENGYASKFLLSRKDEINSHMIDHLRSPY